MKASLFLLFGILSFILAVGIASFTLMHIPQSPSMFEDVGMLFSYGISFVLGVVGYVLIEIGIKINKYQ